MKCIVAVDKQWNIGRKGNLLMYFPQDLKHFRHTTEGNVVVMGYNTLCSFPKRRPLKNRTNIVLSRKPNLTVDGAIVCDSLNALAEQIKHYSAEDVYVIGGETVYRQLLPYCSEAIVTKINHIFEADTSIPNLDEDECWIAKPIGQSFKQNEITASVVRYINQSVQSL